MDEVALPLERFFEPASVARLLARGHPYDFIETYQVVRALYGYRSWYVNLGLWREGPATVEAGRVLALRVAEPLGLSRGERLIDAGAGLGQAAVDLVARHALGSVLGVNVNARQAAFANALASASAVADRVTHVVADACTHLGTLPPSSAHGVMAVECAGHFADPGAFLAGARRVLAPGRRLSFCLNVLEGEVSAADRGLMRATFGFVPCAAAVWDGRLRAAGFTAIEVEDLTSQVTASLCEVLSSRARLPEVRALPWTTRTLVRTLNARTTAAVRSGKLRYLLFTAVSP